MSASSSPPSQRNNSYSSNNNNTALAAGRRPTLYQIDFTAVASGKRIATTKRRVRWYVVECV